MFAFDLGAPELIILIVLVLLLFGGSQLPKLAKNLGKAQKEFRDGITEGQGQATRPKDPTSVTDTTTGTRATVDPDRVDSPRSTDL